VVPCISEEGLRSAEKEKEVEKKRQVVDIALYPSHHKYCYEFLNVPLPVIFPFQSIALGLA
jgi:hypothetical protein